MLDITIDIETVPDQREGAFERYIDAVEPPGNYKKQESIDAWLLDNAERVAAENYQKTALNGLYGEICSIAWAVEDEHVSFVTRGLDGCDSESDLLEQFWANLKDEIGAAKRPEAAGFVKPRWIGHNLLDFDLRFLKQRSIVNGTNPAYFIPADARHGSDYVFDTMKEWAGWRGYVKLDELVDVLGIEIPPEFDEAADKDGSQVWEMYRNKMYSSIALYNCLDVYKTREIYKRMTYA